MKNVVASFFILLSFVACHEVKPPEKPENLIAKDKMVNIIIDMSLLSGSRGIDKTLLERNNVSVESYIYDKYDIDSLTLVNSHEYYAYNIETYDAIYIEANDSLKALKEFKDEERKAAERLRPNKIL